MTTITIPRKLSQNGDLVIVPKKEFDELLLRAKHDVSEEDILRWSKEAKAMKKYGKLPQLHSLRGL